MAINTLSARIQEAASARGPKFVSLPPRQGYVPGIPLGGATESNPGQNTTSGALDRTTWMDQLFQAYLSCPWVADCIDVIARTCTAGGLQVVPNSIDLENTDSKTPAPPIEVMKVQTLLEYINEEDDVRQLMRSVITDLLIYGDSFTEIVYKNKEPIALYPLDPRTMDVLGDEHGKVTGYHQKMDTGQEITFKPNQVIHVKLDAPGAGLYGVSPTQKNYVPITIWLFTAGLIQETMRKGDPPRLHTDWPIALPLSEQLRLQQQYLVRNLGAKNVGNMFETKGGAEVKELGVNKIQDWQLVKTSCRDEIISGFGTPPSKVGVIESANIGGGQGTSQDRSFRVNTCGPISEIVLEKFTFRLLYLAYGVTDWHLKFGEVDWRDDMTIEQIRDLRVRNGSWTLNRLRRDISEPPVKGGDVAIIVDRQNMVAWHDMEDLSAANLQVVKLAGTAPPPSATAPGAPGKQTPKKTMAAGSPLAPSSPKSNESYEDDWVEDIINPTGRYMTPFMEDQERKKLEEAWRDYKERQRAVLSGLEIEA